VLSFKNILCSSFFSKTISQKYSKNNLFQNHLGMLDENVTSQALLQILPNQTCWMAWVPENVCFNKLALGNVHTKFAYN